MDTILEKPKRKRPLQLGVDIRPDQRASLQELLPRGTQRPVMEFLLDELIALLQSDNGASYLGAFIKRELSLKDVLVLNRMDKVYEENGTT